MKEISVKEAFEKAQQNVLLVDVREENEVKELSYDVPNIINIPLSEFQKRYNEISENQPVIMVCKSGGRSGQATRFLMEVQYQNVCNMKGGILAWCENNFPVK